MITQFYAKTFDQQIKDAEALLLRIEKRFGKDSNMWRSRAKALREEKRRHARTVTTPIVDAGVFCG